MQKLLFLIMAVHLLGSCSPAEKKPVRVAAAAYAGHFRKLPKLLVTGNFDGDQQPDTVYQHTLAGRTKRELDRGPDPAHYDWDTTVKWLTEQQAEVALTLNKPGSDTLRLGPG